LTTQWQKEEEQTTQWPKEEEQTTQWSKEKVQRNTQQSTKHTYKTKGRVLRTPLKLKYGFCINIHIYIRYSSNIRTKNPMVIVLALKYS
jgi:hypothetical protein